MKVKDLIKELGKFNENKEVFVWSHGLIEIEDLAENHNDDEDDDSNGDVVVYLKKL